MKVFTVWLINLYQYTYTPASVSIGQSKNTSIKYFDAPDHDMVSEAAGMVSSRHMLDQALDDMEQEVDYDDAYLNQGRMSVQILLNPGGASHVVLFQI